MNFWVKPYDPLDEALELFSQFNQAAPEDREQTEAELTQLIVHRVNQYQSQTD